MQGFKNLHQQDKPLLLANVWDVSSATCAEQAGYHALGTSSAAIASVLGYDDGERMPFDELAFMIERIATTTSLPLTVDIEAGYSRDPKVIAEHIKQLCNLGVIGVNIEDSLVGETRTLVARESFSELIRSLRTYLTERGGDVFINVRSDVFLLGIEGAREEAILRAKSYQHAGANGVFFPCVTCKEDIRAIVEATTLPLNVMAMPDLPDITVLADLGVKRVSTGNFSHDKIYGQLTNLLVDIKHKNSCQPLFT
ncbi:isocitrate lyase/phosphoenolpyruvate mutase family protein [Thalassotalea maritima]|uniref:isocitrate lyase/PEP mutase family protein n=1 Tax=Thalassotalea maritima TaxID=3242416 RepID=UPI00352865B3